jgi:hypothetical protein
MSFYITPNFDFVAQSIFMATILCVPIANQIQVPFIHTRGIYEIRERPSRMYSWTALITSQILVELPWNILGSSVRASRIEYVRCLIKYCSSSSSAGIGPLAFQPAGQASPISCSASYSQSTTQPSVRPSPLCRQMRRSRPSCSASCSLSL